MGHTPKTVTRRYGARQDELSVLKESVEKALNNPLLDVDVEGASGALINVSGGQDITIKECQEIVDNLPVGHYKPINFVKLGARAQIRKDARKKNETS